LHKNSIISALIFYKLYPFQKENEKWEIKKQKERAQKLTLAPSLKGGGMGVGVKNIKIFSLFFIKKACQ